MGTTIAVTQVMCHPLKQALVGRFRFSILRPKRDREKVKVPPLDHDKFLRMSFDVAKRARANGNHPFGSILVSAGGDLLLEVENGFLPDHDMTGHAERLLATQASKKFAATALANCTIYSSAEPCAMCAGAIYWAGIGRVVYGLSEHRLKAITGPHEENPTLDLPCRIVFAAGQRQVEVIGPLLEDEAAAVHADFWQAAV
jgi:tRNA(Arg) A34 adenosine deaminase TadA